MAQPAQFAFDIVLTLHVQAGKTYNSADILALAPAGTTPKVVILQSDEAMIGVNSGDAITWHRGDYAYIVSGRLWTFTTHADLALAQLVNLTV